MTLDKHCGFYFANLRQNVLHLISRENRQSREDMQITEKIKHVKETTREYSKGPWKLGEITFLMFKEIEQEAITLGCFRFISA